MQQFVGVTGATAKASDGLKTWQRTVLAQMGLLATGDGNTNNTSSSTSSDGDTTTTSSSSGSLTADDDDSTNSAATSSKPLAASDLGSQPARVMVSIGGDPPVRGPLLAACRVMLSEVRWGSRLEAWGGAWCYICFVYYRKTAKAPTFILNLSTPHDHHQPTGPQGRQGAHHRGAG